MEKQEIKKTKKSAFRVVALVFGIISIVLAGILLLAGLIVVGLALYYVYAKGAGINYWKLPFILACVGIGFSILMLPFTIVSLVQSQKCQKFVPLLVLGIINTVLWGLANPFGPMMILSSIFDCKLKEKKSK